MDLKKLFSRLSGNRLLFLLGALGLVFLLFSGVGGKVKTEEGATAMAWAEAYRATLEEELTALCTQVEGVGEAHVFLTLASSEIAVYEKNQSGESETLATSGGEAVLLAYRPPEIAGVTVVCAGGDSPAVKRELCELLSTALAVGASQIHIAPLVLHG